MIFQNVVVGIVECDCGLSHRMGHVFAASEKKAGTIFFNNQTSMYYRDSSSN